MTTQLKKVAGLIVVIAAVVLIVVFGQEFRSDSPGTAPASPPESSPGSALSITVKGKIGGEKVELMRNPAVQKILRDTYHLRVEFAKEGSIEMVRSDPGESDFLWPSSQVAAEFYKDRGGKQKKTEVVLNTPIVFFAWDIVTDALIAQGFVQKVGDTYYFGDPAQFVKLMVEGKKWKELGLTSMTGKVNVVATDPNLSNSGLVYAGLLANLLNGNEVVDDATVDKYLPTIRVLFARMGRLEDSSGTLFAQFLSQGAGAYPIIAGYESQLVEFVQANPGQLDLLQRRIHTIYPKPTVWSSHAFIAISDGGARLLAALQDKEIQRLAWEQHGFRPAVPGVLVDPKALRFRGVPESIDAVVPMPASGVMDKIRASIASASS